MALCPPIFYFSLNVDEANSYFNVVLTLDYDERCSRCCLESKRLLVPITRLTEEVVGSSCWRFALLNLCTNRGERIGNSILTKYCNLSFWTVVGEKVLVTLLHIE